MRIEPRWLVDPDWAQAKAHLVHRRQGDWQTWCGTTLASTAVEAPVTDRCRSCLASVEAFVKKAVVPPPDTVEEIVTVKVVRPSMGPTFAEDLERKFRRQTTWTIEIVEGAPRV